MDRQKLVGFIQKKHGFRADPDDPVFVAATISEAYMAEARAELQKVVAEYLAMIEASHVNAEAAATKKAEMIISQGAEFTAKRIKEVGEAVVSRIQSAQQATGGTVAAASSRAVKAGWAATIAAVLCVSLFAGGMLALFKF